MRRVASSAVRSGRELWAKFTGGYPGGWHKHARGSGHRNATFAQPDDADDLRSRVPPLGLTNYWYPAVADTAVKSRRPTAMRIKGEDVVLFRDTHDRVRALGDVCPHRGASLSEGRCHWKGYVSCPYHGATFDGDGACVAVIPEGPDSRLAPLLSIKSYPTVTLKGTVFIWVGDQDPVDPTEDVPPEFFDDHTMVFTSWTYWKCNWMVALENTLDSHNFGFVHRRAIRLLKSRHGGIISSPLGFRSTIENRKSVKRVPGSNAYYKDEHGRQPFQLEFPDIGKKWPLRRTRLLWTWFFEPIDRYKLRHPEYEVPSDWVGQRVPGMVRNLHWNTMYTRWCVPVESNLTRAFYVYSVRPRTTIGRAWQRLIWPMYDWIVHFNFSGQDGNVLETVRYDTPETLSPTDMHAVATRRLMVEMGPREQNEAPRHRADELAGSTSRTHLSAEAARGAVDVNVRSN